MATKKEGNTEVARNTAGLRNGLQRFTITAPIELIEKLKDYAYTERITIKEACEEMLHMFLDDKTDLLHRNK